MMAAFFCFLLFGICNVAYCLELKQVLVLSRHNLRTPLTENIENTSPKTWPKWKYAPGELTEKGVLLEGYLGEYFSEWLAHQGLLPKECSDDIHAYANTRQRTKDTAKAFVDAAFPNCNVPVHFKNSTEMDPIFNPVIHNTTEAFRKLLISEMSKKLKEVDLKDVYLELNRITDINKSQMCKDEGYCDLANDETVIIYQVGMEPNVDGPLCIGNSLVDFFLMSYYEGFAQKDIAWGEIKSDEQWKLITRIVRHNQDVRFKLPKASNDFVKPLLQYMKEMFNNKKKFTLLVGHDSNLNPLMTTLGFKPYTLPGQMEMTPIGSKLVFQRWSDGSNDFLKVEFVYQSWPQIRNAEKLSLVNPPKNITMFLNNLTDNNGFYRWSDFEKILLDATE